MVQSSGFFSGKIPTSSFNVNEITELYNSPEGFCRLFLYNFQGKKHVLKALKEEYLGNPVYEQLLRKEFEIGFSLDHPHIVRTEAYYKFEQLGYVIVMEYIDGITLKDLMAQNTLNNTQKKQIILQLCATLNYVHIKQIVHRDLKPENILLTHNGLNVKLTDFGLSDSDYHNNYKEAAGTLVYASPEQVKGEVLDNRSDIFSLGVIINELTPKYKKIARKASSEQKQGRYSNAMQVYSAINSLNRWKVVLGIILFVLVVLLPIYVSINADEVKILFQSKQVIEQNRVKETIINDFVDYTKNYDSIVAQSTRRLQREQDSIAQVREDQRIEYIRQEKINKSLQTEMAAFISAQKKLHYNRYYTSKDDALNTLAQIPKDSIAMLEIITKYDIKEDTRIKQIESMNDYLKYWRKRVLKSRFLNEPAVQEILNLPEDHRDQIRRNLASSAAQKNKLIQSPAHNNIAVMPDNLSDYQRQKRVFDAKARRIYQVFESNVYNNFDLYKTDKDFAKDSLWLTNELNNADKNSFAEIELTEEQAKEIYQEKGFLVHYSCSDARKVYVNYFDQKVVKEFNKSDDKTAEKLKKDNPVPAKIIADTSVLRLREEALYKYHTHNLALAKQWNKLNRKKMGIDIYEPVE